MNTHRVQRVVQAMVDANIDAMLLAPGADMYYLSGFEHGHAAERLLALVIKRDGNTSWIVPQMNVPQVVDAGIDPGTVRAWSDGETFLPALRDAVAGVKSVAFDDEARCAFLLDLLKLNPGVKVAKASSIMRKLRARKDADELKSLRECGKTVDNTIDFAVSLCKSGKSELQIERELREELLKRANGGTVAFTIIASGPNAALPHHETSSRILKQGDAVILDFGTRQHGYHSDITVTCCVGEPNDPEIRRVYDVIWRDQDAAIHAVKPCVKCEDIDRAARSVIEQAGYGDYFLHRTGHGLGLMVHEPPYMVAGNTEPLEVGNVFSIEPGIYLAGRFGVRLEIIASVGASGAELMNVQSRREMPIA